MPDQLARRFEASRSAVEEAIQIIGDVLVVECDGIASSAQRRCRVAVTEPRLRLQRLALVHKMGGDAMAEPVQRGLGDAAAMPSLRNLCERASAVM